ncbi:MAG: anti-sigma factor ChrR (cupin superfamily) [Rickettsiales bacterium]|jgi:anti-sigma factor ChrR (cupin superfamily)
MNKKSFTLNADFDQRIVIKPTDYKWQQSPQKGVDRMMLDRIGDEIARATTIVRYNPNSDFPTHIHNGGEEFFVLEGIFEDENGEYPAGTYVRNPIGTKHAPKIGPSGATIFVKLQQFSKDDSNQVKINTNKEPWRQGMVDGLKVMLLHSFEGENVALVKWSPNTKFNLHKHWGGEEIFVLKGTFYDEYEKYPQGSWIRSPHLSFHTPFTKEDGALIYVKTGHLFFE